MNSRVLKSKTLLVTVIVFFSFTTTCLTAQQTPVEYSQEQRIELAKKLLEPMREIAIKDQTSEERLTYFLGPMANIDPNWTARFILENPVEKEGTPLYDHNAKLKLASKADEIDEKDLVRLIEGSPYMRHYYVLSALKSLPKEKKDLRSRLVSLAMDEKVFNFQAISSLRQIAKLSGNAEVAEQLNDRINEYYESGTATETFEQMKKEMAKLESYQQSNMRYSHGQLVASAPAKHRKQFLDGRETTQWDVHFVIVSSSDFSQEERMAELNKIEQYEYGKQTFQQMMAANSLGVVALVDLELAQKWANEAPSPTAKIWGNLLIAPTLAKSDKQAAKKLILDCYRQLSEMDSSARIASNYNFPPSLISVLGLRVVEHVDPKLLPRCIRQSIELAKAHSGTNSNSSQQQQFRAIVGVARYDREKAEEMFDAIADDVQIHAAASFFRALMALHPDQVLEEYQTMPEKDNRGTDYRIYVRSELIPALTAETDSEFWDALSASTFLKIDERIFEE